MILKEIDIKENLEKFQKYGYAAEKQMAFYLKRAYQDNNNIQVINDLRLEMNEDVAQIDHLIIHRFGFIIIESKSVTSKISINAHGEWTRHYPKFTRGIPSPVNQAKRQADFLKNFLMVRSKYLLKKTLVFQASITDFKFDILVAISDSGIINRARNTKIDEVYKADQVVEAVNDVISNYAGTNKSLLTLKVNYQFADSSMEKISKYLIQSHKPKSDDFQEAEQSNDHDERLKDSGEASSIVNTKTTDDGILNQPNHQCQKCNSKNIEITYGKYGYYFKCRDCNGNTSIKLQCKNNPCKSRIRKDKTKFYQECSVCNTSVFYFENKSTKKA